MGFGIKIINSLVFGAGVLIVGSGLPVHASECDPATIGLRGDWGRAQFSIEVADDAAERAQGLMHREQMAASAGMLFVYEAPQSVAFWMKNTLIPLDMLFIDPSGVVISIHENANPLDETPIPGGHNILYVLEINGGLSGLLGISAGSEVLHPAIDKNIAVWACETQ